MLLLFFITDIPVILSYDTVVNHCIKNVIAIPAVASIIEEVKDTLMRYHLEISAKVSAKKISLIIC